MRDYECIIGGTVLGQISAEQSRLNLFVLKWPGAVPSFQLTLTTLNLNQ